MSAVQCASARCGCVTFFTGLRKGLRLQRDLPNAKRRAYSILDTGSSPSICHPLHTCQRSPKPASLKQSVWRRSYKSKAQEEYAKQLSERNRRILIYGASTVIAVTGVSYASVELYKVFCQATGFGGTTQRAQSLEDKVGKVPEGKIRPIKIFFNADVSDATPWKFWPTQPDIVITPGETALAFFTVKNKTDKAIMGVATYNVHPPRAGLYFNKIQCFCFDEQRLKPREEIDMPVFFFVDPDFLNDPSMENVHEITLSYTFFKTEEDVDWANIPLPETPAHQPITRPQPRAQPAT